ncbi:hypothetical protein [Listeria booriae]|uniref:hypothetical protein n=1 Tax=Listeria booriae TaxID=1552123 RepID=UPI0021ADB3FB|nr:hypothetical protein [Listeria booriae]
MMKDYWVTLDDQGFINAWSEVETLDYMEVRSDTELFKKLDFVRVIDGVAEIDEARRQQVIKAFEDTPLSETEQLRAQNIELRDTLLDLAIIIDSLGGELE